MITQGTQFSDLYTQQDPELAPTPPGERGRGRSVYPDHRIKVHESGDMGMGVTNGSLEEEERGQAESTGDADLSGSAHTLGGGKGSGDASKIAQQICSLRLRITLAALGPGARWVT